MAGFGNAVDLSLFYFKNEALFDNVNLDADRGYAFAKIGTSDGGISAGNLINVRFIKGA